MRNAALNGQLFTLDCTKVTSRRHISFILQHLLEGVPGLAGSGCYVRELVPLAKGSLDSVESAAEIDAVFDCIRDHGPLATADNENLRWIKKQRNDPQSPLFQHHAPTIEKRCTTSPQEGPGQCCSGLPGDSQRREELGAHRLSAASSQTATQFATIFLGPAGIGKAPLANEMCTSLGAYWQKEHGVVDAVPKFKSGNTLDFFRSEPGSLFVPAVLDDGNMASETIVAMKAFLDVAARIVESTLDGALRSLRNTSTGLRAGIPSTRMRSYPLSGASKIYSSNILPNNERTYQYEATPTYETD